MSAIIAGLFIGGVVALTYLVTRGMGKRTAFFAMLIVGGGLAFVLKGCIFG